MNKLSKFLTLIASSCVLASCGGDPQPAAQAVTLTQVSHSAAQEQLAPAAYYDVVQKIYVGYFGRPADVGGLAFFAGRLSTLNAPATMQGLSLAYQQNNADIKAVIDVFGGSQESADLYPGDNGVFIDAVYANLFGRAPDTVGKAFWVNALNLGLVTRASAAVDIMAGAQGTDIDVINKKTTVAAYFTSQLVSDAQKAAYGGLAANAVVRTMLATVVLDTDTTAFQSTVTATIANLVATSSPAGLYFGKLGSNALLFSSLILEDGQYWGFYSRSATGRFNPGGLLQGSGAFGSGTFNAADIRDLNPSPYGVYDLATTVVKQVSLDGAFTAGTNISLVNAAIAGTSYQYDAPASISDIQGDWSFSDINGYRLVSTVNANGSVGGTTSGCSVSGNLQPRASGKNVFDASLNFSGQCRLAAQAASGIGYTFLADDGSSRQLVVGVTNAARSLSNILNGARVTPAGMAPAYSATDSVIGSGATVTSGKTVTVHYTGWLYNGNASNLRSTRFETSVGGTPFSFKIGIGQVIAGWDQGVLGMRVGGKRTLVLPASLAYGTTGSGTVILPNAGLVFEVEVLSIL